MALKSGVPIVPVAIIGTRDVFPRMFTLQRPKITLRFGPAFTLPPLEREGRDLQMQRNIDSLGGVVHSQKVLLALTQAGISREAAYAAVQGAAMQTWQALGTPEVRPFAANLLTVPEVAARFDAAKLAAVMDPAQDFRAVDTIFARVFGAG